MKTFLILPIAVLLAISGCAKHVVQQQAVPRAVSIPAFAKGAVNAVGGEPAWANTQVIVGECTAKFYKSDGTFYLTRQRHAIYPWSDSIRIYDAEPQGTFVWQLSGNCLTMLEGTPRQAASLPIALCSPDIARAIWAVCAAPACVAVNADPNTAALGKAMRVEGLWHYPLKLSCGQTLYQDKDSNIFDIYTLSVIMARGYDYRLVQKAGILVPTKIEIFKSSNASECQQSKTKIIEFNYNTLESIGF